MAQSPDEIFDIVDENDAVVGTATRAEVHANNLWHRATHILVLNSRSEILIQKRSELKDTYPGVWTTSCAGHLDAGEGYLPAAQRELQEELGIIVTAEALRTVGKFPPSAHTGWEWITVYQLNHDGPFIADPAEVADLRFITPEELDAWIAREPAAFAPSFVYVWQRRNRKN